MTDRVVRVVLTGEAKQLLATVVQVRDAEKQVGAAATQAAAQATAAFDKVEGAAEATATEIKTVGTAARQSAAAAALAGNQAAAGFNKAEAAAAELVIDVRRVGTAAVEAGGKAQASMRSIASDATGVGNSLGILSPMFAQMGAAAAGAFSVMALGRVAVDAIKAGVAFDSLNQKFQAVFGSAAKGGQELAFVSREAERLGLDVRSAADAYGSFAAASLGTNLAGEKTRDIFSAVSEAAGRLHLSADQTNGALLAIQQMMSKGSVQAEELRGQLGERLPGAFQVAARAMGVSTAELGKMLEQGQVATSDFLPRFATELRRTFGTDANTRIDSVASSFARLRNEISQSSAELGKLFNKMLAPAAGGLADFMSYARQNPGSALASWALRGVPFVTTPYERFQQRQELIGDWQAPGYSLPSILPTQSRPFYSPGTPADGTGPGILSKGVPALDPKLLEQYRQRAAYADMTSAYERAIYDTTQGSLKTENDLVKQAALRAARADDDAAEAKRKLQLDPAAAQETDLARLRAQSQAELALASAKDDQLQQQYAEQLRTRQISDQQYLRMRGDLEAAAIDRNIAAHQAELGRIAAIRSAVEQAPVAKGQEEQRAQRLQGLDVDRVRVQGQINALRAQEESITERVKNQIAAAAAENEKRLADVRTRMAQLQSDAAAIAAETRARLEREYAALLNDPSTSDQGRTQIRSLIDRETLQAEFDAVRQQADGLMQQLRQRWDGLSQSVQAGTVSTVQAQGEYSRALADTNPQLQQFLEQLQQLAQRLGPDARREVSGLSNDVAGLALNTRSPLQQLAADWGDIWGQMQSAGVSAMQSVAGEVTNALTGAETSSKALLLSILRSLAQVAVQAALTGAALRLNGLLNLGVSLGTAGVGGYTGSASAGAGSGIPSVGGTYTPTFAKGRAGVVRGPGTGTSDSILARISNGESILTADVTSSLGSDFINMMNREGVHALDAILAAANAPAYAQGGTVGDAVARSVSSSRSSAPSSSGGGLSLSFPMEFNFGGGGSDLTEQQAKQLGTDMKTEMEAAARRVIQRELGPRGLLVK